MRLLRFTSWEGIFPTIRNLFHIFMFYILKSTNLYRSGCFFFFFRKNCYKKNIQNLISYKRVYIDFRRQTHPFSKWSRPPTNDFSQFFQHKLKNIRKVFLLENILLWKKILWRISFVLIKFLLNALLFEKLQNECKNPSFLHKVTCIRSDHAGAVAKFNFHGFIL